MRRLNCRLVQGWPFATFAATVLAVGTTATLAATPSAPPGGPSFSSQRATSASAAESSPQPEADGDMLDSIERVRRVMQQAIAVEVRRTIQDVREHAATFPETAKQSLLIAAGHVRSAPELDSPQRVALLSQLAAASREIDHRLTAVHQQDDERLHAAIERQIRIEVQHARLRHEQVTADGIVRVNLLTARGQHRQAETEGLQLASQDRDTIVGAATAVESTMRTNIFEMQKFAERRRQQYAAEFRAQEEKFAVESDNPPVKYPTAAKWQEITERRKKWREASTYQPTPGEIKIREALQQQCSIDFQAIPIEDALDYLRAKFGIEIQLDQHALSDLALGPSTPVTRNASGIRLRSALRLILEDLGLTWVVRDDVLLVTSVERADEMVTTRVYDVADLVIPIPTANFGSGRMRSPGMSRHRLPGGMPF